MGDSIAGKPGVQIQKSIYTDELKPHGSFYNWAWGSHYKSIYYTPVSAKSITLNSLFSKVKVIEQLPKLQTLILENNQKDRLMLKPLGESSGFLESQFFQNIYNKKDFKDTYLGNFILEAHTIINPYMLFVSDHLAHSAKLNSGNPQIFHIAQTVENDTTAIENELKNKLVSITQMPSEKDLITSLDSLIYLIHKDGLTQVDMDTYIRTRIFDMLIGDWNKIPENWNWIPLTKGDTVVYVPQCIDRSHAFSKVEGFLFKELLNTLNIGFITNYEGQLKNIKKFNTLSFPLDIALTGNSTLSDWLYQTNALKGLLTDTAINEAFARLPLEVQNEEAGKLKKYLKERIIQLHETVSKYYTQMQKYPVITGTSRDEQYIIRQDTNGDLLIRIYDTKTGKATFDKRYTPKQTKEVWIYPFDGNDTLDVDKNTKNIKVLLIGGKGHNKYNISDGKNVFVYESKSEKEKLNTLTSAKVIIPDDEAALIYDYQRTKYATFSIAPIGIYDSDLGLNLGASVAYTMYGFKRTPYTRFHQVSYNFNDGFTYQGVFPSYNKTKSLHILAYVGSPAHFSNFFGFGNNTKGYKDVKRNFNRVNIYKYMFMPSLYYKIGNEQTLNIYSAVERYEVKNPEGNNRFINQYYKDDHSVFSKKYFLNLGATYEIDKKMPHFVSSFKFTFTSGWNVSLLHPKQNFAYITGSSGVNLKITDQITFATLIKGTSLFSDNYEFYQAASTELRGFRKNRFIGQRSLYQYSDIRLDMGPLHNPFLPLGYGVFLGIDNGRVWYPGEDSGQWHYSYGGGFWLSLFQKVTGKFSCFSSSDGNHLMFQLGMGF